MRSLKDWLCISIWVKGSQCWGQHEQTVKMLTLLPYLGREGHLIAWGQKFGITEFRSAKVKSQTGTHQLSLTSIKILKNILSKSQNK